MQVETWPLSRVKPYPKNARNIPQVAIDKVALSLREYGWRQPMVVEPDGTLIVGHVRLAAALQNGWTDGPVHIATDLTKAQIKAYRLMDNRSHDEATWNFDLLGPELSDLQAMNFDLTLTGFDMGEIRELTTSKGQTDADEVPPTPADPVTRHGDLWLMGEHRLLCGDCRDLSVMERLLGGELANVVVTSPPYASQRKYDKLSGFKPIPPNEYIDWFRDVAANVHAVLSDDGSYFLNIKEHCEGGQRHLYVKDLTIAHVREWGWMFVDEFCWRNKRNGVPGGWNNRFKNAWEPVFHYARSSTIRFDADAVSTPSDDTFEYSGDNPKSKSGSALLGSGRRKNQGEGLARPSNVIEVAAESEQGEHSAPFPVALVEFFIKAFSRDGDVVLDPFMGSGSTLIASEKNQRKGYGIEVSPLFCDVIVTRWQKFTGREATLEGDGRTFSQVATERCAIASTV